MVTTATGRLQRCVGHLTAAPALAAAAPKPDDSWAWAQPFTFVAMDPALSCGAATTAAERAALREVRLRRLAEDGFVIIDDFAAHPLVGLGRIVALHHRSSTPSS